MIINLRGTSGSGKTTLVRRVTELYRSKVSYRREGRKQPIGYAYMREKGRSLAIIGHYETPCGGCDTISSLDEIFNLVREAHANDMDVIFEGLLISSDVNRTIALQTEKLPVQVIALATPLDLCLASVNMRRQAKTPGKEPVNPKNTTSKHRAVQLSMTRLQAAGVPAHWLSREDAFGHIKSELRL